MIDLATETSQSEPKTSLINPEAKKFALSLYELVQKVRESQEHKVATKELPIVKDSGAKDGEDRESRPVENPTEPIKKQENLEVGALTEFIKAVQTYIKPLQEKPLGDPFWDSDMWLRIRPAVQDLANKVASEFQDLDRNKLKFGYYEKRHLLSSLSELHSELIWIQIKSDEKVDIRGLYVIDKRLQILDLRLKQERRNISDSEKAELEQIKIVLEGIDADRRTQNIKPLVLKKIRTLLLDRLESADESIEKILTEAEREAEKFHRRYNSDEGYHIPEEIDLYQVATDYQRLAELLSPGKFKEKVEKLLAHLDQAQRSSKLQVANSRRSVIAQKYNELFLFLMQQATLRRI